MQQLFLLHRHFKAMSTDVSEPFRDSVLVSFAASTSPLPSVRPDQQREILIHKNKLLVCNTFPDQQIN